MNAIGATAVLVTSFKGKAAPQFNVMIGRYPEDSPSAFLIVLEQIHLNGGSDFSEQVSHRLRHVFLEKRRTYLIIFAVGEISAGREVRLRHVAQLSGTPYALRVCAVLTAKRPDSSVCS